MTSFVLHTFLQAYINMHIYIHNTYIHRYIHSKNDNQFGSDNECYLNSERVEEIKLWKNWAKLSCLSVYVRSYQ
jgi:hypothetical protein